MQTTPTFDAIHGLIKQRNSLIEDRGIVRQQLRGSLDDRRRAEKEIEFWHIVGRIDGINAALEALREAGEKVGAAEWMVIEEAAKMKTAARDVLTDIRAEIQDASA